LDISSAAKPGESVLEVEVVNTWNNRLVGDAGLTPDQRKTWLLFPAVDKNAPLLPACPLGPVTVTTAKTNRGQIGHIGFTHAVAIGNTFRET
jgi:hypothetical protein